VDKNESVPKAPRCNLFKVTLQIKAAQMIMKVIVKKEGEVA